MKASLEQSDTVAFLLGEGKLAEAVAAVSAVVKAKPISAPHRILLAELLALQGANERADGQLKVAGDHSPAELLAISQMRWLIRAAEARRAWYEESAVPTFIGEPTRRQRDVIRLALFVRYGKTEQAQALREQLENESAVEIAVDGAAPAPFRDVCDLSLHGFEALTLDGRYFWIAPEQISQIRFAPVRRPRDLLWRKAETTLNDGRDAIFFLMAQYYDADASEAQRLAKTTDWIETVGGVTRGRGQRVLLVGDEDRGILDMEHIVGKVA